MFSAYQQASYRQGIRMESPPRRARTKWRTEPPCTL